MLWLCLLASLLTITAAVDVNSTTPPPKPRDMGDKLPPGIDEKETVIAETHYGNLRGRRMRSKTGVEYNAFLGVSYAFPPTKDHRFKLTFPPKHWHGFRNAFNCSRRCIQNSELLDWTSGDDGVEDEQSEDCLYANVLAPAKPSNEPEGYPVLFFVHDGWFNFGSMNDLNLDAFADRFVSRGVVVMTIQYRLGLFGFMSTGDRQGMGNWGLWDLIQGLKYVRDNIKKFGGDRHRVTLFGYGAGAAAVSFLNYLPEAEHFFNQTIVHSGSAHSFWAGSDDRAILATEGISDDLECGEFDTAQNRVNAFECLRKKRTSEIVRSMKRVEKIIDNYEAAVPELLYLAPRFDEILISRSLDGLAEEVPANKPMLVGVSQGEMARYLVNSKSFEPRRGFERLTVKNAATFSRSEFEERLKDMVPNEVWSHMATAAEERDRLMAAKELYMPEEGGTIADDLLLKYNKLVQDVWFNAGAHRDAVVNIKRGSPVWLYNVDFESIFSSSKIDILRLLGLRNVAKKTATSPTPSVSKRFAENLFDLWINLIIHGNPLWRPVGSLLEWPQYEATMRQTLVLSPFSGDMHVREGFYNARVDFWDELISEGLERGARSGKTAREKGAASSEFESDAADDDVVMLEGEGEMQEGKAEGEHASVEQAEEEGETQEGEAGGSHEGHAEDEL